MKFSILVPAYKAAFLRECIESILSQTYNDFELIIVNDASPENLASVVSSFDDARIHYYVNKENCGALNVVDNWNLCLSYAKGDYVICMGDDDMLSNNCLEEYAKLIDKYPGVGLLHGWTVIINEESKEYRLTAQRCEYESVVSLMWHRWFCYKLQFIGDFCFERKWLLENGGFYKLPLAWASDDISAYIGASKNGVANTQTVVFKYRINTQSISKSGNASLKMEAICKEKAWYVNFLRQPPKDPGDALYYHELKSDISKRFLRKKALLVSDDLKNNSFLRVFFWIRNKAKYGISMKTILYAVAFALR